VPENKSLEKRDALIEEYRDYVQAIVGSLIQTLGLPGKNFEEFEAAGYLGLVEAASRFDFNCGREFKFFAFLRIRGSIIDSIRECADVSGIAYHRARAFQAAHKYREVQAEVDQTAPSKKKKGRRGLEKVFDAAAAGLLAFRLSVLDVEEEISGHHENPHNPEAQLFQKRDREIVQRFLATLPEKERFIIEEFYFKDKSFVEIAEEYEGLSKSWISRLHARALDRFREFLEAEETAVLAAPV
jgi:RNA polymerase sigma factor for flagellar operon FliA